MSRARGGRKRETECLLHPDDPADATALVRNLGVNCRADKVCGVGSQWPSLTHICRARCPKSAPRFECWSRRSSDRGEADGDPRGARRNASALCRFCCRSWLPLAKRARDGRHNTANCRSRRRLGRMPDARDASTSTQKSAKRRITQRTTIAGPFPSSCRLSSLGLVAVGGRMTPVCCPTRGGSVQ
jgi:hypothetical protein